MTDYEYEEMYDKYADCMSDFCSQCLENGHCLEGDYREDIEMTLCDHCYEEEKEVV